MEKLTEVSNESFIPKPQIDSTVVKLTPKENSISDEDFRTYSKFTKALFQHRNKKIKNALIDSRHIISNIDKKVLKKRLNDIEKDELAYLYPEFDSYYPDCRFKGCSHISEPDCAVKKAVEEGRISRQRYDNYCLFYEEIADRRPY